METVAEGQVVPPAFDADCCVRAGFRGRWARQGLLFVNKKKQKNLVCAWPLGRALGKPWIEPTVGKIVIASPCEAIHLNIITIFPAWVLTASPLIITIS